MSEKHTPGPWTIQKAMTGDTLCFIRARLHGHATTSKIAEVTDLGAQGDANARLIAAAPELLTALQACLSPDGGFYCTADVERAARAAIAKATSNG